MRIENIKYIGQTASIAVAYGIFALYMFQFGFFQIVGLQFIGFLGPFDVFFNIPIILPYIVVLSLVLWFVFVFLLAAEERKFSIARTLVEHRVAISFSALVLLCAVFAYIMLAPNVPVVAGFLIGVGYSVVFFLIKIVVAVAQYQVERDLSLPALATIVFSFMGAYAFGLYNGFYRSELQDQFSTITYKCALYRELELFDRPAPA